MLSFASSGLGLNLGGALPSQPRVASSRSAVVQMGVGDRRVVVTGMGIVSCLGSTLEDVTTSLRECKSGIKFSEKYQEVGMKSHICGRPDIDCDEFIDRKQGRFMGLNAKYAFIAMEKAKADAGLSEEDCNNPMVGGILGQGGTSIQDIAETLSAVERKKLRQVGPYRVTRAMGSTTSAVLATTFKLQGTSYSISSACSTGAHCIGVGMEQIQLGKGDVMHPHRPSCELACSLEPRCVGFFWGENAFAGNSGPGSCVRGDLLKKHEERVNKTLFQILTLF